MVYPVRESQHLGWGWLEKDQLIIEGGVKALPSLTGFSGSRRI